MKIPRRHSEAGATLIELIVAVAIMGIAFVAILGGIGSAIIGAGIQRRDATSGLVLASAAEQVVARSVPYKACATPADYPVPPSPPSFTVTVVRVTYWDVAANRFILTPPASCTPAPATPPVPPSDAGLQLLELKVTADAGSRGTKDDTIEVVKRQDDP